MKTITLCTLGLALIATPVLARDFCPDRPGIDTPPCTVEPGRVSAEASVGDWTHDTSSNVVRDTILIGDVVVRYGTAEHAEIRIGWTAFGHVRTRDPQSGATNALSGTGDVTLGVKRNLVDPDGKGFSVALLPSISLPMGGNAIGAGDWGAGLQVPINIPVNQVVSVVLTPELDAAVNSNRNGRHRAFGTAGGLAFAPLANLNIAMEAAFVRDEDPAGASTQVIAGIAAGLMLDTNTQVDIGSEFGLYGSSPDSHVYFGIVRRF